MANLIYEFSQNRFSRRIYEQLCSFLSFPNRFAQRFDFQLKREPSSWWAAPKALHTVQFTSTGLPRDRTQQRANLYPTAIAASSLVQSRHPNPSVKFWQLH